MLEQWKQVINYFRTNIAYIAVLIVSFSLLIFAEKSSLPDIINVFIGFISLVGIFTSETFLLLNFHPVITFVTSAILVNFCGGISFEGNLASFVTSFIGFIGTIGCLISAVRLLLRFHPRTILIVSSIFLLLYEKLPISESLDDLISGIALMSFLISGGMLLLSWKDANGISLFPEVDYSVTQERPSKIASFLGNTIASNVMNGRGKIHVNPYNRSDGTSVRGHSRRRPGK